MQPTKSKIQFLEEKQIRQIIDGIGTRPKPLNLRDKAILEVLYSTGLRVHELCELPDAPFATCKEETLELSIIGKGDWQRTIYFSPTALKAIKEWLAVRTDADVRLFPIGKRGVQYMVKKRATKVGLDWVHVHTIRHSFATNLLDKGANIFYVKEFLGHKALSSTQKYLHVKNSALKELHNKLYK